MWHPLSTQPTPTAPTTNHCHPQVQHEVRRPTRDGLVLIDVALRGPGDRFVALQLLSEEETCANSNGRQLLGAVRLKREVLEKNGWLVSGGGSGRAVNGGM